MLGIVGVILGCLGLAVALFALKAAHSAPQEQNREVLAAFKQLERDCESMWEQVQTHLGRISRLKQKTQQAAPEAVATAPAAPQSRFELYGALRRPNA